MRRCWWLVLVTVAMLAAACGGSDEPGDADAQGQPTAAEASTPADADPEPTETGGDDAGSEPAVEPTPEPTATAEPAATAAPERPPSPHPVFVVEAAEAGPNPLLQWPATDGAVLYRLVVLDSSGSPYWAWSGAETSVRLGLTEEPTALAPRVFEPMTWTVSAHDADGLTLAVSEPSALQS